MKESALLIIGASARAAAFSALRAGLQPWCVDLFADADLRARVPVTRVLPERYPEAFVDLAQEAGPGPWLYTGGLENRPDLVRRIANRRPLWGNDAAVLRRVRSPFQVAAVLEEHQLPCPAVWASADQVAAGCPTLIKPLRSAGGARIGFWQPGERGCLSAPRTGSSPAPGRLPNPARRADPGPSPRVEGVYFQEYVPGEPCAAIYLAAAPACRLLGVTRQLVGEEWLQARPFHYCGSIGPMPLPPALRQAFEQLGSVLTRRFELRGLFGVDCVLRDNIPWPVEVNPRYAASVEVLEHGLGIKTLRLHRQVFETEGRRASQEKPPPLTTHHSPLTTHIAKAILYAREQVAFPADGPWIATLRRLAAKDADPSELPAFADIPQAGEKIPARRPILTFFATSSSWNDCYQSLQQIARDLDRWLFGG